MLSTHQDNYKMPDFVAGHIQPPSFFNAQLVLYDLRDYKPELDATQACGDH